MLPARCNFWRSDFKPAPLNLICIDAVGATCMTRPLKDCCNCACPPCSRAGRTRKKFIISKRKFAHGVINLPAHGVIASKPELIAPSKLRRSKRACKRLNTRDKKRKSASRRRRDLSRNKKWRNNKRRSKPILPHARSGLIP